MESLARIMYQYHPRHIGWSPPVYHSWPPQWISAGEGWGDRLRKNAFCMAEGLFQNHVISFGFCNAPASFHGLMDLLLAGLQWSRCLEYLDDIIIYGHTFDNHLQKSEAVLNLVHKARCKLKPSKCSFLQQEVQYLGHIMSQGGVTWSCQSGQNLHMAGSEFNTGPVIPGIHQLLLDIYTRLRPDCQTSLSANWT